MIPRDEAGKYMRLKWKWMPKNYELETCEFSDGFTKMNFVEYLKLWKHRLGGNTEIIKTWRDDRWFITLVELEAK